MSKLKMTFRWYGENDPVTLEKIAQIPGMTGIVSAVYGTPVGEAWAESDIARIKDAAAAHSLAFEVVESVPVHEDIKLGNPGRDRCIEAYITNIRRLAAAGVKVICYNFMPVFDWLRSELDAKNSDNSTSLIYNDGEVLAMDPAKGELSLPGWDESYTKDQLQGLLRQYGGMDEEALWRNLTYFLEAVIPVCEECGVNMAIHPDDPPWGIFSLPRIITNEDNLARLLDAVPSRANGLTLCTGSLGVARDNDVPAMIRRFGSMGRIHFLHARNIRITGERDFRETAHPSEYGSLDMYEIMRAAWESGFDGYVRPDHGRMIWGETGKPGYGLYDRALGAVYLAGLWEAITKR